MNKLFYQRRSDDNVGMTRGVGSAGLTCENWNWKAEVSKEVERGNRGNGDVCPPPPLAPC